MIYLASPPTGPLFMLHLASLTLARLDLATGAEPHRLVIDQPSPPPDEILAEFAATLETMVPGSAATLDIITRPGHLGHRPVTVFAPANGSGFVALYRRTSFTTLALGIGPDGHIGPIFAEHIAQRNIRDNYIRLLIGHLIDTENSPLAHLQPEDYDPRLWITRPDTLATSSESSPSPAPSSPAPMASNFPPASSQRH